ncbi:g2119 [Coccomyxa elongata]
MDRSPLPDQVTARPSRPRPARDLFWSTLAERDVAGLALCAKKNKDTGAASTLPACCGTPVASEAGSRPVRSHLQVSLHQTDQTTERTKSRVTITDGDGNQVVYHTSRRDALHQMLFGMSVLSSDSLRWMWAPRTAQAALVQFPATSLHNKYFLVRAGEGESEAENYVLTNPVAKTSMSAGLSQRGKAQVVRESAPALRAMGACASDCWLWPSITQRSYQTAEILGALLGVGRSRIVPEYSFLDPRGLGALEGLTWDSARAQVTSGDQLSPEWRPPRGTDGTPNESVSDVLVRVRQVLSITETQYSGANVIVVAPDSDNLSVLQAALLGLDLRRHGDLAMRPGEVRAVELAAEAPVYYSGKVSCARPPNCL